MKMSFYVSVELYEILALFSGKYMSISRHTVCLILVGYFFDRSGNKVQPWANPASKDREIEERKPNCSFVLVLGGASGRRGYVHL